MTAAIIIGLSGIMTDQLRFLFENHHMNFIPTEIELEESVAILVASFGAFLEYRRWLLEKVYEGNIPRDIEAFTRDSYDTGILMILLAVSMESINLFFLALNTWGLGFPGLKYLEICIMFFLNLTALFLAIHFGYKNMNYLLRRKPE